MILFPRGLTSILVKVLEADVMVLAFDHPVEPSEIAFRLVRANFA